jgi:26S proteasome regulatory subunit N6
VGSSLVSAPVTDRLYRTEFSQDPIIKHHLADLFDRLLEQNLLRIVEPYSVVEISYIASHVELRVQEVEGKWVASKSRRDIWC